MTTRRPWRLLWLLPVIMAFDSPGCVMAEDPLTRFNRNATDGAIVGDWAEADAPDKLALSIGVRNDGIMEFRSFETDGSYIDLLGHVSRIDDRSYANLQFIDAGCLECSDDERAAIRLDFESEYANVLPDKPGNTCTWMIVPYDHADGLLRTYFLSAEAISEAISANELDGYFNAEANADFLDPTCVTASPRRFRRFLSAEAPADTIVEELNIEYIRWQNPDAPAAR